MINLSIVIYFLLFAFVIGWMFLNIKGFTYLKGAMIAAMFYVSSAIIFSFSSYMGWPVEGDNAPDTTVLTSVLIFDKTNTSDGYIYVTGIPCAGQSNIEECMRASKVNSYVASLGAFNIFGYVPTVINTPRIYTFPYTEENRKNFAEARENMANGGRSVMRRGKKNKGGTGEGEGGQEGEGQGGGKSQSGDGTPNSLSEGAQEIWVDNIHLSQFLRKDQVE
jgi:uncharacterized membrane protein YgcG